MAKKSKTKQNVVLPLEDVLLLRMLWEESQEIKDEENRFQTFVTFAYTLGSFNKNFVPPTIVGKILDDHKNSLEQFLKEDIEKELKEEN